jgi:hypothetical protein
MAGIIAKKAEGRKRAAAIGWNPTVMLVEARAAGFCRNASRSFLANGGQQVDQACWS